jgi:hypothetical protein
VAPERLEFIPASDCVLELLGLSQALTTGFDRIAARHRIWPDAGMRRAITP